MDVSRTLYLILTLLALAFPVRRYLLWFQEHGVDLPALFAAVSATQPALGLVDAVLIASLATLIFIIGESLTRRDRVSLIAVPVTLIFGVAVGLPFYLFLRLRPMS